MKDPEIRAWQRKLGDIQCRIIGCHNELKGRKCSKKVGDRAAREIISGAAKEMNDAALQIGNAIAVLTIKDNDIAGKSWSLRKRRERADEILRASLTAGANRARQDGISERVAIARALLIITDRLTDRKSKPTEILEIISAFAKELASQTTKLNLGELLGALDAKHGAK